MDRGISRRNLLGLGLTSLAVAGCSKIAYRLQGDDLPKNIDLPKGNIHPTVRFVNRLGFGPKPGQIAEVEAKGHEGYLDDQLSPTSDEPLALQWQLSRIATLRIDGMELRDEPEAEILRQLQQAALLRATYSNWQLRERMVDFWGNHFNIYARKGLGVYRKPADDSDVIRKNALGYFPKLLNASAHSPAMLAYLDNQVNKAGRPNENYARELMELHTLGLHGGYTQKDVMEVARCFTGWGIENRYLHAYGTLRFDPDTHDDGAKLVLGHVIPPGQGERDVAMVLDILASHPSTAHFIASKISRHFLGTTEGPWVEKMAVAYRETNGHIPSMIKPLLLSDELRDGPPVAKRPLDFVVSALRALDAESDCGADMQKYLADMGQSLFEWPMPDGYPDRTSAWTGSLLARWNFSFALASGQIRGTTVHFDRLEDKMTLAKVGDLVLDTSAKVDEVAGKHFQGDFAKSAALALCAPEFQWR
ncbi:MAG TPA: DUF1800 domain-containing protein [Fimbriimonadaceae bacterium]|nr:DUF1800 domain-containing protein [Fimbriimonadaceae bacterium]